MFGLSPTLDALLHGLEVAVTLDSSKEVKEHLCDEIVKVLRSTHETPDWKAFPKARTYFCTSQTSTPETTTMRK